MGPSPELRPAQRAHDHALRTFLWTPYLDAQLATFAAAAAERNPDEPRIRHADIATEWQVAAAAAFTVAWLTEPELLHLGGQHPGLPGNRLALRTMLEVAVGDTVRVSRSTAARWQALPGSRDGAEVRALANTDPQGLRAVQEMVADFGFAADEAGAFWSVWDELYEAEMPGRARRGEADDVRADAVLNPGEPAPWQKPWLATPTALEQRLSEKTPRLWPMLERYSALADAHLNKRWSRLGDRPPARLLVVFGALALLSTRPRHDSNGDNVAQAHADDMAWYSYARTSLAHGIDPTAYEHFLAHLIDALEKTAQRGGLITERGPVAQRHRQVNDTLTLLNIAGGSADIAAALTWLASRRSPTGDEAADHAARILEWLGAAAGDDASGGVPDEVALPFDALPQDQKARVIEFCFAALNSTRSNAVTT